MEDEIHFLVNELEGELHGKIQNLLKDLDTPLQKKNNILIKKFTRALVQATAQRMYVQPRQQTQKTDTFVQLEQLERNPILQPIQIVIPQPIYYTPVMPFPPAPQRLSQPQEPSAVVQEPKRDNFLPSGLPPKPPEAQQLPKLPTDETLSFTPDSLTQYKLPLPPDIQKAQSNPQFAASQPPSASSSPASISTTQPPVISLPRPQLTPPIALIVDAESKRSIVTVTLEGDTYTITEPPLMPEEINMVTWLRKKLLGKEKKLSSKKKLNKKIWKAAKKMKFRMQKNDENEYLKMKYYLVKHLLQAGWTEPLFHDEAITKIICEGENKPLAIVRNEKTLKTNIIYPSARHINQFLIRCAERAGKKHAEKESAYDCVVNGYHLEGSWQTATTPAKFTMTRVVEQSSK